MKNDLIFLLLLSMCNCAYAKNTDIFDQKLENIPTHNSVVSSGNSVGTFVKLFSRQSIMPSAQRHGCGQLLLAPHSVGAFSVSPENDETITAWKQYKIINEKQNKQKEQHKIDERKIKIKIEKSDEIYCLKCQTERSRTFSVKTKLDLCEMSFIFPFIYEKRNAFLVKCNQIPNKMYWIASEILNSWAWKEKTCLNWKSFIRILDVHSIWNKNQTRSDTKLEGERVK